LERDSLFLVAGLISVFVFAIIIKGLMDYFNRKLLINKGMQPDNLVGGPSGSRKLDLIANLKWAFICLGLGLALVARDVFPDLLSDVGILGLMFSGAGIGFFVYFFAARHAMKEEERQGERERDGGL
jgi:hypothetical protein